MWPSIVASLLLVLSGLAHGQVRPRTVPAGLPPAARQRLEAANRQLAESVSKGTLKSHRDALHRAMEEAWRACAGDAACQATANQFDSAVFMAEAMSAAVAGDGAAVPGLVHQALERCAGNAACRETVAIEHFVLLHRTRQFEAALALIDELQSSCGQFAHCHKYDWYRALVFRDQLRCDDALAAYQTYVKHALAAARADTITRLGEQLKALHQKCPEPRGFALVTAKAPETPFVVDDGPQQHLAWALLPLSAGPHVIRALHQTGQGPLAPLNIEVGALVVLSLPSVPSAGPGPSPSPPLPAGAAGALGAAPPPSRLPPSAPPPAPVAEPQLAAVPVVPARGPQSLGIPLLAAGIPSLVLGTALAVWGTAGLALDGQCTSPACSQRYDSRLQGALLLPGGLLLLGAGVTLITIGAQRRHK